MPTKTIKEKPVTTQKTSAKTARSTATAVRAKEKSTEKKKSEDSTAKSKKAAPKPSVSSSAKSSPKKKTSAKQTIKKAIKFDKKITDELKKIVASYTEYPELLDNIESDTTKSFIDELNIDSVDFVEIIVDVEQAFNITIEDDEIYDLKSFEDLYCAIEKKIKGAKKK
ncbi:hypothetical protein GCM10027566_23290 [Arachidicoccus ginsenosidivorans]|jgi:acyl carrier protein|uniref:Acyl carrier protein n=1 Tax=Arachidicoccus ginsenosidivorans TaxID=496057 RepID=A0A5B8VKY1_9BACT|nr:acyl carrier protein [Arachidicoccus ginsenosidivorans]QEC71266.1 acyl carrier protein [Arachidicoccus ginsenosidivorans]